MLTQRMLTQIIGVTVSMLGFAYSSQVLGEKWTDQVTITGFGSAIARITNQDVSFNGGIEDAGIDKNASVQGTRIGFNINARINNQITLASQFFANREEDNYLTYMDWGFISYSVLDEWQIRAGKVKFPVGIVNEYIDVGIAFPWISPPMLFYTEENAGPQATREAYSGASSLWEYNVGDWTVGADLFAGEVALESMIVRKLVGLTVKTDWNEMLQVQASAYQGTMANQAMPAMDGEKHSAMLLGVRLDWNQIIGYAEWADVDMGNFKMGNGNTWYTTLGYQMDRWLPHITYQYFEKGNNTMKFQEQNMLTLGLRYELARNTAIKMEFSRINTEQGKGLFEGKADDYAKLFGLAVDVVF